MVVGARDSDSPNARHLPGSRDGWEGGVTTTQTDYKTNTLIYIKGRPDV